MDLLHGQPVKLVHQFVDLFIGDFDLALEAFFFVGEERRRPLLRMGAGGLFVQREHLLDQGDHAVVLFDLSETGGQFMNCPYGVDSTILISSSVRPYRP